MSKTSILTITALLAAAAVVIGTLAAPAFADLSSTITKQLNIQRQTISGASSSGSQSASNCIAVGNTGGNACRTGP
jgi:hypothetical protein